MNYIPYMPFGLGVMLYSALIVAGILVGLFLHRYIGEIVMRIFWETYGKTGSKPPIFKWWER